jgi:hypothetical protein
LTIRTASPVRDFCLVDLIAVVVVRRETGGVADRAVDVDHTSADSADQMVMVVADAILEASRRSRWLNAADQTFGDEDAEGVVHRLKRDRPDLGPDSCSHRVGRDVGLTRYRPQDSESLSGDLNAALPKEIGRVSDHESS